MTGSQQAWTQPSTPEEGEAGRGGKREPAADIDVLLTSPRREEGRGTSPVASPTQE
jgi:hypothetical protein